jgi:hypothetical protein
MRVQHLLFILSILVTSTEGIENLRGGDRNLQYYGGYYNNDDANGDDASGDDASGDDYAPTNTATTSNTGNLTDTMHQIQGIVINQVQQYKAAATTKGYEFYQTAPSEWTSSQWDFVSALFGGLILTCCFLSVCSAYCCIYRSYDDSEEALTKAQYHRRMLNHRLNRHRARYAEKSYDERDDDTIDDTVYTVESQSTYGQSTYEPETPTSLASSIYISRRELKRREEEKKRREKREQEERRKREEKREEEKRSLWKKRDEKRESLLKKSTSKASPVTRMVKVADAPKPSKTSSRSSTPVRATRSPTPKETKEEADKKAVEEALNYKMHP